MKKRALKSYVFLTAMAAAAGLFTGCTNSSSVPGNFIPIENPDSESREYSDESNEVASEESTEIIPTSEKETEEEIKELAKTGTVGDYNYTLEGFEEDGPLSDRGWFLFSDEETGECLVIISSGRKNTGGYSTEITDIDYSDPLMTITVKEEAPAPDSVVTESLTCPTFFIRLSSLPKDLKIITADGNELNYQGKYHEEFEAGDDYIAVFCDGAGEIMQKTYVYKTDDGKYRYVNVTSVTESWGSSKWKETTNGSGTVDTKEEIVEIAKNHNSCGYVLPGAFPKIDISDPSSFEGKEFPLPVIDFNNILTAKDFINGDF